MTDTNDANNTWGAQGQRQAFSAGFYRDLAEVFARHGRHRDGERYKILRMVRFPVPATIRFEANEPAASREA